MHSKEPKTVRAYSGKKLNMLLAFTGHLKKDTVKEQHEKEVYSDN
jgi:hypothetical protein